MKLSISITYFGMREAVYAVITRLGCTRRYMPVILTYHAIRQEDRTRFLEQMLIAQSYANFVFVSEAITGTASPCLAVTFDDGFRDILENALPYLRQQGIPATIFVATGYLGQKPGWMSIEEAIRRGADTALLSPLDIAHLDLDYVEVGSHSVTHRPLTVLKGDALASELRDSKIALEEITSSPVSLLSVPYGSLNAAVVADALSLGYERVLSNVPLVPDTGNSVLFGRINVTPQDWPIEFHLKIRGAYDWLSVAIPIKRNLSRFLKREL